MKKQIDLKTLDGIIWDMDGVLIDVNNSYREVIRRTAEYFLMRKVEINEVDKIKTTVGMNNDWDATYALVNNISDSTSLSRSDKQYQSIKDIFQSFYLGSDLYKKCYKKDSPLSIEKGLINSDSLLISKSKIQELRSKYKRMGIATGRPRFEADYVLNRFKISELFQSIVCMEDTTFGKPKPDSILLAIEQLDVEKTIYIGDSPNDVIAANAAGIMCIYIGENNFGDINIKNINELLTFLL
jgi:HAD superfamily hydrolase (TIGR01548 family)